MAYVLKYVNICLVVPKENSTYHAEISEFLSFHLKAFFIFIRSAISVNSSWCQFCELWFSFSKNIPFQTFSLQIFLTNMNAIMRKLQKFQHVIAVWRWLELGFLRKYYSNFIRSWIRLFVTRNLFLSNQKEKIVFRSLFKKNWIWTKGFLIF